MSAPPHLASLLLRLAVPDPDLRAGILGDLEEDLACLGESGSSPRNPGLWYWRAILGLSARFTLQRVTPLRSGGGVRRRRHERTQRPPAFEALRQDLAHSLCSLRRDAGLTVLAVAIVGLGIGACSTVFSVANALLIRPLPFEAPEELVLISNGDWRRGQALSEISVQVSHLLALQNDSRLLSDAAGFFLFDGVGDHTLTGRGEPERLARLSVTANFLPLLGVRPQVGRLFTEEEIPFTGSGPILLAYGFWVRRFGGDPGIVGQALTINGDPMTVVGVLPASFDFPTVFAPGTRVDFIAGFPLTQETDQQGNTLALVGRLRPGADLRAAQAEAALLAERPYTGEGYRNSFDPHFTPLREHVSGGFRSAVLLLAGAVGLVMLIVCTNISNLLLARGATREKEIAIRAALGAKRRRLIRQMLTESLVLSVAGSTLGVLMALAGTRALARLDANVPLLTEVRLDGAALGFTIGLTVLATLVFGLMPAMRLAAVELRESLAETGRGHSAGRRGGWVRGTLVVSQVALCCVLLVGAGLLGHSFLRVLDVDLGFRPDGVVALRLDHSDYTADPGTVVANYEEMLRRVESAQGVEAAAVTDVLPTAFNRRWGVSLPEDPETRAVPFVRVVSEGYLDVMGLTLVAGRNLSSHDDASVGNVVLVNETLARALWPGEDPLGHRLNRSRNEYEVVGVVRGTRYLHPEQTPGPEIFFPARQQSFRNMAMPHILARGTGTPAQLAAAVRDALRPMDPNLPVADVVAIQDLLDRSLTPRRFLLLLLTGFAGFALFLAALGLYGVISFSVRQRTREIGIRSALGASPGDLRRRVLSDTLALAGTGMALGLVAAWMLGRLLQGLLFGVPSTDPVTFLGVAALVGTVAALAGFLPATRATRVDPVRALNAEGGSGG
ncbi:MAG: ABC transporter permease [Gemmatimonadota bacterium]